jgi:hypothetical protein
LKKILEVKIDCVNHWEIDDEIYSYLENWLAHATRTDKRTIQKFVDNCWDFDTLKNVDEKIKLVKTEKKEKSVCAVMNPSLVFMDEVAIKDNIWDIFNRKPERKFKQEVMGKWICE